MSQRLFAASFRLDVRMSLPNGRVLKLSVHETHSGDLKRIEFIIAASKLSQFLFQCFRNASFMHCVCFEKHLAT